MKDIRIYIHQPDFAPWLEYYRRIFSADYYIVLDHVQFPRRGWVHRDKIIAPSGRHEWLTIPIKKNKFLTPVFKIEAIDSDWRKEHINLLKSYYRGYEYFNEAFPIIESSYEYSNNTIVDFNLNLSKNILTYLDIFTDELFTNRSSKYKWLNKGTYLMVEIMKKYKANVYITGIGCNEYIDNEYFCQNNLTIDINTSIANKLEAPSLSMLHQLFSYDKDFLRNLIVTN